MTTTQYPNLGSIEFDGTAIRVTDPNGWDAVLSNRRYSDGTDGWSVSMVDMPTVTTTGDELISTDGAPLTANGNPCWTVNWNGTPFVTGELSLALAYLNNQKRVRHNG